MKRLDAIDAFRGLAVVLMAAINYLAGPQIVPALLKHAPDIGFTVADVVAPMFITAIGLTFGLSYRARLARTGVAKTNEHFLLRYLALCGLGTILTALGTLSKLEPSDWGLLQTIGCAGLCTLAVIRLPVRVRWIPGVLLLGTYQLLLDRFWLQQVLGATHGGPLGALSWSAMLILATCLGDLFHEEEEERHPRFALAAAGTTVLGLLLALLVPVSKNRVSASYVLLSLGGSALLFWLFAALDRRHPGVLPRLRACGRNALFLYLLHGLLLGCFVVPTAAAWYVQASWWLVLLQLWGMLAVLIWVGLELDRRHWYWLL